MATAQTVSEFLQNPAIREQLLQQLERISATDLGISYSPTTEMGNAPQFGMKNVVETAR